MESDRAIALFERSAQYWKLIYKTLIADGNSKAYSAVRNSMPYGPLVYITKEECRADIIKRMATDLQTIVKNNKGNYSSLAFLYQILIYFKSTSSFSTSMHIGTFQNFYGLVTKGNKGNPQAMSTATMTLLSHYKENPPHEKCPLG